MAHTVVAVPIPEVEPLVHPRGGLALLTLLGPFAPEGAIDEGILAELRAFFADVLPFEFTLTGLATGTDGETYLVPEPVRPFRHLTQQLSRRFPEYPPYGGAFDIVVPHLVVPLLPGEDPAQVLATVALPIEAHAVEALLVAVDEGGVRELATFAFGIAAA